MAILPSNVTQYTFEVQGLESELRVVGFSGIEAISQLYHYHLELASEDGEIDFAAAVGKSGLLTIASEHGERHVHGIVSQFTQGNDIGRFSIYTAEIVPWAWLLSHRHASRIFQQMSVPDIVKQVLDEAGLQSDQYRFVLQGNYAPREYCVQYRESELNFICRLLEEEGIFFFFEHSPEGHVIVFADSSAVHEPFADPATVLFQEPSGLVPTEEHIYQYQYMEEIRPGSVVLRDFDFVKPSLNLETEKQSDHDTSLLIYDYPGAYIDPSRGANLAQVRLEAFQVPRQGGTGSSVCRRFLPGYKFTLTDHTRSAFNQEYVLTHVSHTARQPQVLEEFSTAQEASYNNHFSCLPATIPFRPAPVTVKPVVKGSQTAMVVGPKGEEIYTNEHGQVKVQFHWDREGAFNEKSSCWIRVSQGWAGATWGAIYIPRIGQEVLVDFLEGDPDKPIITGRVYNGESPVPYKLPDEKTKSTLKSNSSPGGKGFNELRFEDKKGEEQIFIHAEKNQDIRTKNDVYQWVGRDTHLIVKQDQLNQIENDRTETIGRDHIEEVGRDHHLTIKGKQSIQIDGSQSLTVQGDVVEVFKSDHSEETTGDTYIKAANIVIEAMTNITIKVGQSYIAIEAGGIKIGTMGTLELESTGPLSAKGTAGVKIETPAMAEMQGTMTTVKASGVMTVQGALVKIN